MFKKIEQYLIVNHPIIWSLKIVPILILVAMISIALFLLGYSVTNTSMEDNDFLSGSYYLLYAGAILTTVLIFIFWLVQYNRNNGLKAYYPQSNVSLYLEWLAIFAISFFICFIPNALSLGKTAKWRSEVSKTEYEEATKVLIQAQALCPTSNSYPFEIGQQNALLVGDADVNRTKFDTKLYTYEENAKDPSVPIEYVGPSLLYYAYNVSYLSEDKIRETERVKQWLINEEKDSIAAALEAVLALHKKHKLKTNLSVDKWMKALYNPPLYPVDEEDFIEIYDHSISNHLTQKYTQIGKLDSHYSQVDEYYESNGFQKWFILVTLTIAMGLSVMILSARLTSGKSWIFALLALGVIMFAFSLFSGFIVLVGATGFYGLVLPIFWILLFLIIGYLIIIKVVNGYKKGKSNIYINIGIWFIPALILWLYQIYTFFNEIQKGINDTYNSSLADSTDDLFITLIINIVFTLIFMFPVTMLLRKWKALPEE